MMPPAGCFLRMNIDQITSLVRTVLVAIGAILVKKGITDSQTWAEVVGALIAAVPIVWSLYHHADKQQQQRALNLGAPISNLPALPPDAAPKPIAGTPNPVPPESTNAKDPVTSPLNPPTSP